MKKLIAWAAVLVVAGAFTTGVVAQQQDDTVQPPAKAAKSKKKDAKTTPSGPPKSLAEKLRACLEIEDESKERLNCFDEVIPPKPKPKAAPANGVMDCRYVKEEDERLKCFNGFAEKIPKFSSR